MSFADRDKSQYHHYIPRFMLRRWKVDYVPPPSSPDPQTTKSKRKKKGKPQQDDYINLYDTQANALYPGTPLARVYGIIDMYKNDDDPEDVYHIEKLFSKLENQAATILRKLDDAVTGPHNTSSISLLRRDVNILRKFLFLLVYRGGYRSRQFREEHFDQKTKVSVETFKQKHDLKDTFSVWLFNLRNILESDHWDIPENEKILEADRGEYHTQMRAMQLAFYASPDESEFILTENGLGLWEGTYLDAISHMGSVLYPEVNPRRHCWHHTVTFPVSPKLLVMLRTTMMGNQQVLTNAGVPLSQALPSFLGETIPDDSLFKDFPRTPAQVRYDPPLSQPIQKCFHMNDRWTYLDGKIIDSRINDVLTFRIHQLTTEQAESVNSLRLENNPRVITFKSPKKLLSSIRFHETTDGPKAAGDTLERKEYEKASYHLLALELERLLGSEHPSTYPTQGNGPDKSVGTAGLAASSSSSRPTHPQHPPHGSQPRSPPTSPRINPQGPASAGPSSSFPTPLTTAPAGRNAGSDHSPQPLKRRLKRHLYPTPSEVYAGTLLILGDLVNQINEENPPADDQLPKANDTTTPRPISQDKEPPQPRVGPELPDILAASSTPNLKARDEKLEPAPLPTRDTSDEISTLMPGGFNDCMLVHAATREGTHHDDIPASFVIAMFVGIMSVLLHL